MTAGDLFAAAAVAAGAFVVFAAVNRRRLAFGAMALGMTMFYLIAVFRALPLIDRALLRPLREATLPLQDDPLRLTDPFIVKTGGARRPSALFYLPDSVIFARRGTEVIETTDPNCVIALIRQYGRCLVLIDRPSAATVADSVATETLSANSSWVILRGHERQ